MSTRKPKIGWIGAGRMGYEMAQRLARGGCDITVWNRTRAKAEPLAKDGARIADHLADLAGCDILFCMVATYADVKQVIVGPQGVFSKAKPGGGGVPPIVVECSSISLEGSAELRGDPRRVRLEIPRRAGQRQRQGDQGGQALVRVLGTQGGLRRGGAVC